MIGTGLTFAAGVGVVASMIFVLPTWLLLGGDAGREVLVLVIKSSIWAFPIGVAFSGVLAITARGLPFDKPSPPRFAAAGAGGAVVAGLSMSEIVVAARLAPPGFPLIAGAILNAVHYQRPDTVLLAVLALVGVALAAGVAAVAMFRPLCRR